LQLPSAATFPIMLTGHEKAIQAVAISPDSSWIATGGNDDQVRLWRINSSDPNEDPILLEGHSGNILAVTFSPDSQWLATSGTDDTIRLWNINSLPSSIVFSGHSSSASQKIEIASIAVNPNCPFPAMTGLDGMVQILDLETANPMENPTILNASMGELTTVTISYDCKWVATGSSEGTIFVWDLGSNEPSFKPIMLDRFTHSIAALAFDSQNQWLASASSADNFVILWDWQGEDPPNQFIRPSGHEKEITHLDITPDGRWLITGSPDSTLRLWDLSTSDPSNNSLVLPGINILKALDSDDDWVVIGSQDKIARVWPLDLDRLYQMACIMAGRNLTQVEWNHYFSDQPYHQTCSQWPVGE